MTNVVLKLLTKEILEITRLLDKLFLKTEINLSEHADNLNENLFILFEKYIELPKSQIEDDMVDFPERKEQYIVICQALFRTYKNLDSWHNKNRIKLTELDKGRDKFGSFISTNEINLDNLLSKVHQMNDFLNIINFENLKPDKTIDNSHPFIKSEVNDIFKFLNDRYYNPDISKYTYIFNFFKENCIDEELKSGRFYSWLYEKGYVPKKKTRPNQHALVEREYETLKNLYNEFLESV